MQKPTLLLYLLLQSFVSTAFGQDEIDWFDLAENTDAPAAGCLITKVVKGSLAERENVKIGDLIAKNNGVLYSAIKGGPPKDPYSMEIFSPIKVSSRIIQVPGGPAGVSIKNFSHPWVSYLRGELGERGRWDEDLVDFMIGLFKTGSFKLSQWQDIVDQGYPQDDALHDLIELTISWNRGESISPYFFLTRWESELSPIPDTVLWHLETLAVACNDRKLLRALLKADAERLSISKKQIVQLLNVPGPEKQRNGEELLKYAESIRTWRVENRCTNNKNQPIRSLYKSPRQNIENGKYSRYKILLPKAHKGREAHYKIEFRAAGNAHGADDVNSIKLEAWRYNRQKNQFLDLFGKVSIGQNRKGLTYVYTAMSAAGYERRYFDQPRFPLNRPGEATVSFKDSHQVKVDVIVLKKECAIFLNGRSIGHCPIAEGRNKGTVLFSFFNSGLDLYVDKFEVWLLNPDRPKNKN